MSSQPVEPVFNEPAAFWPWPGVAVLALALIRAATLLPDIDLKIVGSAVSSPLGYIWLHLNPALQRLDWPAGSADFRFSLPMRLLLWLVESTHVAPASTIAPLVVVETTVMLVSFGYLAHVLFQSARTTVVLVVVVALAPVAGVNLANFGAGIGSYTPVLFYQWAHAFGFLALAFFLRDRLAAAAVMAALAVWSHVAMGVYAIAFIGGCLLTQPRRLAQWRSWGAILLLLALCLPLARLLGENAHLRTGGVPDADWVLMARLFNWHWFPVELGLFGPLAEIGIFPFIVLAAGYAVARRHVQASGPATDAKLLGGMAVTALITAVGIALSTYWPIPLLIKPALPRASEWISLILLAYVVRDLVRRLAADPWPLGLLAGWTLAALVLARPGIAVLPILVFGLADAVRDHARARAGLWAALLLGVMVLAAADTWMPQMRQALWTPFAHMSPAGLPDDTLVGGSLLRPWFVWVALGTAVALVVAGMPGMAPFRRAAIAGQLVLAVCLLVLVQRARWEDWTRAERPQLAAFKQAQLWAAANTPSDAVFMGNPAYPNGWREYSGRAYFGALAELAHYATLYNSIPGLFQRGLGRVREFGVDPMAVDPHLLRLPGGGVYGASVLAPKMDATFARMGAAQLQKIAQRHGVRYLVIRRADRIVPLTGLVRVYQNSQYDIYDLWARPPAANAGARP